MAETVARAPGKPAEETLNRHSKQKKSAARGEPPSGVPFRSFFACDPQHRASGVGRRWKRIGCSVSLCSSRSCSRVMEGRSKAAVVVLPRARKKRGVREEKCPPAAAAVKGSPPDRELNAAVSSSSSSLSSSSLISGSLSSSSFSSSSSSLGGSSRGPHSRRLSGCYECSTAVDRITNGMVSRDPSLRGISPCPDCGEVFMREESLELHRATNHAVLELGPDDTSRNIVEIIFRSGWLEKQGPVGKIDRVLKISNTPKRISSFESYRNSIKSRAAAAAADDDDDDDEELQTADHARCVADGNEMLRFYCTSFSCPVGLGGAALCQSTAGCGLCAIIRDGFGAGARGKIPTAATSGGAHDGAQVPAGGGKRAMLVCRVVAGRVRRSGDAPSECDSVSGDPEGLLVLEPDAILPCFVVIYGGP